jgi:hypothetical protein
VRLRDILLPSGQRSEKLLQQRCRTQDHHNVYRRFHGTEFSDSYSHKFSTNTSRRHRSVNRLALRSNICPHLRLHEREAPNSRRWWDHRRHFQRHHCGLSRHHIMDVQEGAAPKKTQRALRRAVLANRCVSPDHCIHRFSHDERAAGGGEGQVDWALVLWSTQSFITNFFCQSTHG